MKCLVASLVGIGVQNIRAAARDAHRGDIACVAHKPMRSTLKNRLAENARAADMLAGLAEVLIRLLGGWSGTVGQIRRK
jgi:hypothetical protein